MFCKQCGFKNKDDAKFCVNCGTPINVVKQNLEEPIKDEVETQAPSSVEEVKKDVETVIENTPINNAVPPSFNQINEAPLTNAQVNQKPKKKSKLPLIIVAIVVMVALVGVVLYFTVFNKNEAVTINLKDYVVCETSGDSASCTLDYDAIKFKYADKVFWNTDAIKSAASERGIEYEEVRTYFDYVNPIDDLPNITTVTTTVSDGVINYEIACNEELVALYDFNVVVGSGTYQN